MNSPSPITVRMFRPDLENIPEYPLPAGFRFRWYQSGDEKIWTDLWSATEKHGPIAQDLFRKEFGTDENDLAQRIVFIEDQAGRVVGTAAAWHEANHNGQPYGRIHWVAIADEVQGRGLAKPLMTVVCQRQRALGDVRSFLVTHNVRIPAINLYLNFGFQPEVPNADQLAVWRDIADQTKYSIDLSACKF